MNLFFLSMDPKECAKFHCNKHIVKMILESAQILYAVWHLIGESMDWEPDTLKPYKLTHAKHPVILWAKHSKGNYYYLCNLGMELCKEYTRRYKRTHKSEEHIEWLTNNIPPLQNDKFTVPPQAVPIDLRKNVDNLPLHKQIFKTILVYRSYYIRDKAGFSKWPDGETPVWFCSKVNNK